MNKKFILIEPCNFKDYPVGGQLTFAKQLAAVFCNEIALVGLGDEGEPIGKWFKKRLNGLEYDYFAISSYSPGIIKPKIPARLTAYLNTRKYKKEILSLGADSVFIQSHEILKVALKWKLKSVCYYFPGVGMPLQTPRYPWARYLSVLFDVWFLTGALHADVLAAAADADAIVALKNRRGGILKSKQVHFLSTRVDTGIFKKADKSIARSKLGLRGERTILTATGRIHPVKGWRFLLQAVALYRESNPNCLFIYVGDGGDRKDMETEIADQGLVDHVLITGFQPANVVARYIQAADVFLLGSQKEGWSTSLLEALACGKPIVTTRVSSAASIVEDGVNGFVVEQNDVDGFVSAIEKARLLPDFDEYFIRETQKYSLHSLKNALGEIWPPAK
ncbi:MAG: glycosyltransferase family 4 protein [Candidatus Aminicenantes bacterium]|nr:glycosyltransferase family 4 protein [Candidatus Aminicenantes bacterium]